MHHSTTTIKNVPTEVVIMIIKILTLRDALKFCKALHVPEQIAMQYSDYDEIDFYVLLSRANSYKFLLKNKRFQIKARSYQKIQVALRTYDLDFVKKYIEEFKLDLNEVLLEAIRNGYTDAVKFLLSDSRIEPSASDNFALRFAVEKGHLEIVKFLLSDSRVDPSANHNEALMEAADRGHLEILKLLMSDSRVDPSALHNKALRFAARVEVVKLLLSDSRVDPSAWDNNALRNAAQLGHVEIVKLLLSDSRVDPSAETIEYMMRATTRENVKELLNSYLKKKQSKI